MVVQSFVFDVRCQILRVESARSATNLDSLLRAKNIDLTWRTAAFSLTFCLVYYYAA